VSSAGVGIGGLCIAVVEAAAAVIVRAVEDSVDAFGVVTRSDSISIVYAIATAWCDVDTIGLLAIKMDGSGGRNRQIVWTAGSSYEDRQKCRR
jgi:hypothetical protein